MSTEHMKALLEYVEAGEQLSGNVDFWLCVKSAFNQNMRRSGEVANAYEGSLDAAKALHDAALPGWHWAIDSEDNNGAVVFDSPVLGTAGVGEGSCPARAWLIAILKALIAKGDADG